MLKLIIADDERIFRETLLNIVDWKNLGIEVVGICQNGIDAYDMILDESPDLVITDIKMPGLSGLELIQKAYEAKLNIQFILLSGYSDFEYAKTAMSFGVKQYCLKPCNKNQIIEAAIKASEDCYEQKRVRASLENQSYDYEQIIDQIDSICNCFYLNDNEAKIEAGATLIRLLNSINNTDILKQTAIGVLMKLSSISKSCSPNKVVMFMLDISCEYDIEWLQAKILFRIQQILDELTMPTTNISLYIHKILDYVDTHYSDSNLTLKMIAENYLYMNVDYLSRKFAKEVGKNFSAYLTSVRINKARSLLAECNPEKITYIAKKVGYSDNAKYFSQIFKKYTGDTPSDFAKKIQNR